ncbi:MAG: peptidoglycan bridge formation glycyltransferase FemA/FemB family protein [bacterium]|nr:peptidoglycan bridge formation glycyltransferase FemA/FemB family protein [bacterium]
MLDLRQTKEYAGYMESLGWIVLSTQDTGIKAQIFVRNIPLIGKVAKLQRPERIDFLKLDKWFKENNIKALYAEPSLPAYLLPPTYYPSKTCFVPSKTIHIDLTKPEKQLLKEMKPKTRYNIKVAQKNGVVVKESQDISEFISLWGKSALTRGMWLPQKKEISSLFLAFGSKAHILLATKNEQVLAGILIICTPNTAYYMYAGSLEMGKKLFAPTLVTWEGIRLAKKNGYKVFDFEGIYDERYHSQTKSWQGFTHFKEGFGGKIVTYPQTLVKYSNYFYKLLV